MHEEWGAHPQGPLCRAASGFGQVQGAHDRQRGQPALCLSGPGPGALSGLSVFSVSYEENVHEGTAASPPHLLLQPPGFRGLDFYWEGLKLSPRDPQPLGVDEAESTAGRRGDFPSPVVPLPPAGSPCRVPSAS